MTVRRAPTDDQVYELRHGEAAMVDGRVVPAHEAPVGHWVNPMPVPDDVLDPTVRRAVADWMLAQMVKGKAVVDPIFRNTVLPDGRVLDGYEMEDERGPGYDV